MCEWSRHRRLHVVGRLLVVITSFCPSCEAALTLAPLADVASRTRRVYSSIIMHCSRHWGITCATNVSALPMLRRVYMTFDLILHVCAKFLELILHGCEKFLELILHVCEKFLELILHVFEKFLELILHVCAKFLELILHVCAKFLELISLVCEKFLELILHVCVKFLELILHVCVKFLELILHVCARFQINLTVNEIANLSEN